MITIAWPILSPIDFRSSARARAMTSKLSKPRACRAQNQLQQHPGKRAGVSLHRTPLEYDLHRILTCHEQRARMTITTSASTSTSRFHIPDLRRHHRTCMTTTLTHTATTRSRPPAPTASCLHAFIMFAIATTVQHNRAHCLALGTLLPSHDLPVHPMRPLR